MHMERQMLMVQQFHEKFNVPVLKKPALIPKDRSELRHALMEEEVGEYLQAVREGNLKDVAKELMDILYALYGTMLEHGLQDVMEEIFEEVHKSNMSKEYHEYKMVKGVSYREANLERFFRR